MKKALVLALALCVMCFAAVRAETWTQLDYIYEGTSTGWFAGADYVFEAGDGSFAPYAGYHAALPTGETVAHFDFKLTIPDLDAPLAWDLDFGALWAGELFGLYSTCAAGLGSTIDFSAGWDAITFAIPEVAFSLVTHVSDMLRVRGEFDVGWNSGTSTLTIDRILLGFRIE